MADKSIFLWSIGGLACLSGMFLVLLGLAAIRWPLEGWKIQSRKRGIAISSLGLVVLLGGMFSLSRVAFYVLVGITGGPLVLIGVLTILSMGGFLVQFTMPPFTSESPRKVRSRRATEIAEGNAEYLEILRRRLNEGSWAQMNWEQIWSQCSGKDCRSSSATRGSDLEGTDSLPGFLEFILTQCSVGGSGSVLSGHLYFAYRMWCRRKGATPFERKRFDRMILRWTGAIRLGRAWTAIAHGRPLQRSWGRIKHCPQ